MALKGWPRTISWQDFATSPARPRGATVAAHIEGEWRNPPREPFRFVHERSGWRLDNVNLVVVINSHQTWVVQGQETPELLQHEQGHWDITGLLAREAHQAYEQLRARTMRELNKQTQRIQTRLQTKAARLNRKYDDATNHGIDRTAQQTWDSLIATCITKNKHLPDS
jgi:hypothetical protein